MTPTQTSNEGPRAWKVTLADGSAIEVRGRRVIVTPSGALMVLNSSGDPRRIFSHHAWLECELAAPQPGPRR